MSTFSWRQAGYGAAVFIASACGLVIEIVAGRLMAPYVGMSLYTWTSIIAVVLAGFSAGNLIGGRLAGPDCSHRTGARRVAVALVLSGMSSVAVLVLLRLVATPLESALPPLPGIVALALVLFFPPSLFVGIVSPILTKLAIDDAPGRAGAILGRMYALAALGSIAGTLASGFVFVAWIGATGTVLCVAAVYGLLALPFALSGRTAATAAMMALVLGGGFGFAGWRLDAFVSACDAESAYYCIRIDDFTRRAGRASRVMVLDHLAHGINDRDDPARLHSPYLQLLDRYARGRFAAAPAVFAVGGGALTLPRAWAASWPGTLSLVAEIDPAVTQAAQKFLWAQPSPAIRIVTGDARAILQGLPRAEAFDVVLGDAFHDIAIPAHLVTREFNREVRDRLAPRGIYAINLIDGGPEPLFLLSVVKTLALDFASVEVWIDADDAGSLARLTYEIIASDSAGSADRLDDPRSGRSWIRLDGAQLAARIAAAGVPTLTDDHAPVDRLLAHVLLDRALNRP